MASAPALQIEIADHFNDQAWRLANLYQVVNKRGRLVRFTPNEAQIKLLDGLHHRNVILKARQFGFTTLMCIYGLDCALFWDHHNSGIIAHNLDDAERIFRTKVRVPYKNLPEQIKAIREAHQDRSKEYTFSNGSAISVSTSYRSGTLQLLHVSEFGKIAAKTPDKAREIITGALEAVPQTGIAAFESTAEGNSGRFYDMCQDAQKLMLEGRDLTPLDFKFHFQPWYESREYRFSDSITARFVHTDAELDYFEELADEHGIEPDANQKAWYCAKARVLGDDMFREYPSTPEEAFQAAIEGAYYAKQMAIVRREKRIRNIPIATKLPVHTAWDLGRNDMNAIWWFQQIGPEIRLVDYYENHSESLMHYAKVLKEKPYLYGKHLLPHDVEVTDLSQSDNLSRREVLEGYGIKPITVVERIQELGEGIEMTRQMFNSCYFDEVRCARGIVCLDNYRREFDDKTGTWKDRPAKTPFNHGADAFRQIAQGFRSLKTKKPKPTKPKNWRTR